MSELIDPESGDLATPACEETRDEMFIAGTEPHDYCRSRADNSRSLRVRCRTVPA